MCAIIFSVFVLLVLFIHRCYVRKVQAFGNSICLFGVPLQYESTPPNIVLDSFGKSCYYSLQHDRIGQAPSLALDVEGVLSWHFSGQLKYC